jgi:hypothetical protein
MQMTATDNSQIAQESVNTESFTGRSVFLVETTAAGISVQTALLTNDSKLLRAPAVFPDIEYAFTQIDELKRLVSRHFSDAARIGAQVVAAQQANQLNSPSTSTTEVPVADSESKDVAQENLFTPKAASRSSKSKKA